MNTPNIVITAKQHSARLNNKNFLPLGGKPLVEWSFISAQQTGIPNVIVSTDSEIIKELAKKYNFTTIFQNRYDANNNEISHIDIIKHAVNQTNNNDNPIILLQPTSPFRTCNIISKCWKQYLNNTDNTILTTSNNHFAEINNGKLTNHKISLTLWDGCVAVYPPNKIGDYTKVIGVRNNHINSLQIDNKDDYIQACYLYETIKPISPTVPPNILYLLNSILKNSALKNKVTLVTRKTEQTIPQNFPVIYINHCQGYDGGRCDGLFLIANQNLVKEGINKELRECATKSKFIIIRDNGELPWLLQNLPEIIGKYYPIRYSINQLDDHLTTGCIAANILSTIGLAVDTIGLYKPEEINQVLDSFHYPAMSREIALLYGAEVLN